MESFAESAAWPDDLSDTKLKVMQNWHFENIIIKQESGSITSEGDDASKYVPKPHEAISTYVKYFNLSAIFILI